MLNRKCLLLAVVLSLSVVGLSLAQSTRNKALPQSPASEPVRPSSESAPPLIQLAILLDNSGSMSGLIEQAKSELWRVVNELTSAKQNGLQPRLQVALYTYGDPPPKQLIELTDDLDRVSESLFAVSISGGSEYCGQTIDTVTRELTWSKNSDDLKLIFIAGNEPFSQGPINYREACQRAIAKGIVVNTIHCGNGIPGDWRDGALLADGKAMSINQDTQVVHIEAPQDAEIARIGAALNKTYVPFGVAGRQGHTRQSVQDSNAAQQSAGSSVQRAVSKANAYYNNSTWDLVDAVKEGTVELSKLKKEDLPKDLQGMDLKQQRSFLAKRTEERTKLQTQINKLNSIRKDFVAKKRNELAQESSETTLDQALIAAIRSQAADKKL